MGKKVFAKVQQYFSLLDEVVASSQGSLVNEEGKQLVSSCQWPRWTDLLCNTNKSKTEM